MRTVPISTTVSSVLSCAQNRNERGELPGEEDLVEVPAWRHAAINYPHPLLKRGLVVLDTPGLNAIGAEPELTWMVTDGLRRSKRTDRRSSRSSPTARRAAQARKPWPSRASWPRTAASA